MDQSLKDAAPEWKTIKASRDDLVVVSEYCAERAYIEVEVPPYIEHIWRLIFKTVSHDQGFSGDHKSVQKTYKNSHTWFEAVVLTPSYHHRVPPRHIQFNLHADILFREHTNCWDYETGDETLRWWLRSIRPGDAIQIVPRAHHQAWRNYISFAEITVHASQLTQPFDLPLSNSLHQENDRQDVPSEMFSAKYSIYRQLDRNKREIRLLKLFGGSFDEPISCTMEYAALDDARYECLSYCWGDLTEARPVIVSCLEKDKPSTSKSMQVTANLYDCLQHLRPDKIAKPRTLWIDALCINQNDLEERADQVAIMRSIFSNAEIVNVWLGRPDKLVRENIEYASTVLKKYQSAANEGSAEIHHMRLHEGLLNQGAEHSDSTLLEYEWFQRVWVLQECFNAKAIRVMCGHVVMSWSLILRINECLNNNQLRAANAGGNTVMPDLFAGLFTHSIHPDGASPNEYLSYSKTSRTMPIIDVILRGLDLDATDPRDKIYALLSFGDETWNFDAQHALIRPDYTKSVARVYADFTRWWITYHESLRILSAVHASGGRTWQKLLSRPDIDFSERATWSIWHDGKSKWTQSSLGLPRNAPWSASSDLTVELELVQAPDNPMVLSLLGRQVDMITEIRNYPFFDVYEHLMGPDLPKNDEQRRMHDAYCHIFDPVDERRIWKSNIQRHHLQQTIRSLSPEETKTKLLDHLRTHASYSANGRIVSRTGSIDCHSACYFSTANGHTGLCPSVAREGDIIVVLHGASMPFLVRKGLEFPAMNDISNSQQGKGVSGSSLVGECYLNGFMQGRAVHEQNDGKDAYPAQRFDLV